MPRLLPVLLLLLVAACAPPESSAEQPECSDDAGCDGGRSCVDGACIFGCARDENCASGERCVDAVCRASCAPDGSCPGLLYCVGGSCTPEGCTSDGQCGPGMACDAGYCFAAQCWIDSDCGEGFHCDGGTCIEGINCDESACYGDTAYCAQLDGGEIGCAAVACGSENNTCSSCGLGPDGGALQQGGPIIYFPMQVPVTEGAECMLNDQVCPTERPWQCAFSFYAWDPDGDLPADVADYTWFVHATGTGKLAASADVVPNGDEAIVYATGCFAGGPIYSSVLLTDLGGRHSQTLCLGGEAR